MSTPAPSQRLGPYELIDLIGKGGMGEVWRARDPRLGREVAIKISAQQFSDRFEREAHAVAALNHPNICTLFDVGPNYLVMELIEGDTPAGPMAVDEVLKIARQIAEALDAAHEKGIVHRDLKPANIKLRPDGSVKVLDFGLAKSGAETPLTSDSPTMLSVSGTILGTAAYMSPEQARGKPVDKRADIWAFGVVVYELITGKKLFDGESISDVLANVLKEEPDLSAIPGRVRLLVAKCLEKDPKKRLRDIGDWAELVDAGAPSAPSPAQRATWRGKRMWIGIAVGLAFVAVAAYLAFVRFGGFGAAAPPTHLTVSMPPNVASVGFLALSPDGRKLALSVVYKTGQVLTGIAVRPLDSDWTCPLN